MELILHQNGHLKQRHTNLNDAEYCVKNVGFPREFTVHTIRCSSDTGFRWTWLARPAVALVRGHQPQLSCRSRNQSTSRARVAKPSRRADCSLPTALGRSLERTRKSYEQPIDCAQHCQVHVMMFELVQTCRVTVQIPIAIFYKTKSHTHRMNNLITL